MAVDGGVTTRGSGHQSPGVCGPSTLTPFRLACPTNDGPFPQFFSLSLSSLLKKNVEEFVQKNYNHNDNSRFQVAHQFDN